MFAKLKKKIVDEQGGNVGEIGKGPATLPVSSPVSKERTGYDSDSGSSIQSPTRTDEVGDMVGTKEDVMNLLIRRTEQCKKLEAKISEYAAIIKDKNKNIEKLEDSIQKHQEETEKRIQDMNEQYQLSRAKLSEGFTLALQKKDEERDAVEQKLKQYEDDKNKMFKREEEKEELQELASQELAKVKHLLLNTQEELSKVKVDLDDKSKQLELSDKKVTDCQQQLKDMTEKVKEVEQSCALLTEENSSLSERTGNLSGEKQRLEERIKELTEDQKEKSSALSFLEATKTDLENDKQTLTHNFEVHKNKSNKQLEEKNETIEKLQERIGLLEQRFQDQSLSGDDRVKAMEVERSSLEQKLEEARHQLTEIKSSWSEKITHHEKQIAHLNQKIMEDTEERAQIEKAAQEIKDKYDKQIQQLKKEIEDAEKRAEENWQLANKKEQLYEKEKHDLETKLNNSHFEKIDLENQLRAKIDSLEAQIFNLEESMESLKNTDSQKIVQMESIVDDYKERCQKFEERIQNLEGENTHLKEGNTKRKEQADLVQKSLDKETSEKTEMQEKIKSLEGKLCDREMEVETDRNSLREKERELIKCSQEKDELCLRNAELSQQLTTLKRSLDSVQQQLQEETKERDSQIDEFQKNISDLQEELERRNINIQELEETNQKNSGTNSQMSVLEQQVIDLQDQVADKNRELKKKEQRLTDLKKTLQRELRVQSAPPSDQDGERSQSPLREASDGNISDSRLSPVPTPKFQKENSETRGFTNSLPKVHELNHVSSSSPAVLEDISVHEANSRRTYSEPQSYMKSHPDPRTGRLSLTNSAGDMNSLEKEVNFQYLKHVILKFMLSRESEAVHLIRAVSVLLKFTAEEQKLIRETLEWKMSWFGSRPAGGGGQRAKFIPPNH
ncbi:hypothetical protein FSP39_014858 [Pinctada imbricata]|uniref:Golgin subfamily A member 1 n=1 Tax=Pinctada imbricata TaxID=66713 RepID=A0AA88XSZ6_PINIB|nr:hypothetical protein FSP39_014858 [Pinctada imbricata]